ncbi:Stk1 family PASTA domain-containing Ser/Thr kinase [uncultured Microbacterium sp.]|uniref:Stk1 family PASTA domain-containing Ser/Thr kinase n=1 Tax=uncultured Microbacterium sp. TaxID=191216 RepID=UPI0025E6CC63|nr:Stk1 family PASTA domain-containing Ser/Thr kinase [uncultured Microbacterium sp.]
MHAALADPLIGRLVDGRYRVRARIARGGMATVYVATDLRLERRIALKVMHGHLSDDAVFQSRFIQEARSAARLADPHVVNVFDQGQDDGLAYLVMEYLPGITLRELLREQRRLSVAQTITIMDATLSGLAAAHRAGIVHRDVKPENILLAEDGRIKIGDFGLARATTANTASGQMLLGTIAYLAPELVTRGTADARSDIYALGIMLYEMLTGEQPYRGEAPMQIAYRHANDQVPRPSAKNPSVPEPLDELVLWATERNPDDRPLDAGAMLDRLRDIEREIGVAPSPSRPRTPTRPAPTLPGGSGEVTRVMPAPTAVLGAPPAPSDNATLLRRRARRRRARAAWALILVLVLAAAAAGAGWWFGQGPGSQVSVASVSGLTLDEATARLAQDTLQVVQGDPVYSLDFPAGQVVSTVPDAGARVDREATVTLVLSLGARPTQLASLAGKDAAGVEQMLRDAGVAPTRDDGWFSTQTPKDRVITVILHASSGDTEITGGGTVYDGQTATLTVSLGPVPDVGGTTVEAATATLQGARLVVASDQKEEFSDQIDEGRVIGIAGKPATGSNWRPGDTVTLVVSKGPELFSVPDVTGKTLTDAKKILTDAGFTVSYNPAWDVFPIARVNSQKPAGGSMQKKGTDVALSLGFED